MYWNATRINNNMMQIELQKRELNTLIKQQQHKNRMRQLQQHKQYKRRANRKINSQAGKYPLPNVEVGI